MENSTQNNFVKISYQFVIEDSIIKEFEDSLKENNIDITVKKIPESNIFSYDGNNASEIIIYISQHKIDILASLLITESFALIKSGVVLLFEKIKKKTSRKTEISVQIQTGEFKKISFVLNSDLDGKQIEVLMDKFHDVVKTAQKENWYSNDDIADNHGKNSQINCSPNSTNQDWEEYRKSVYHKKLKDALKGMDELPN